MPTRRIPQSCATLPSVPELSEVTYLGSELISVAGRLPSVYAKPRARFAQRDTQASPADRGRGRAGSQAGGEQLL